jgi:hypothetical protein
MGMESGEEILDPDGEMADGDPGRFFGVMGGAEPSSPDNDKYYPELGEGPMPSSLPER